MSQTQMLSTLSSGGMLHSLFLISGVYVSFLAFGIVQENIYLLKSAETGEGYAFPIFLVFCMCAGNLVFAALFLTVFPTSRASPHAKHDGETKHVPWIPPLELLRMTPRPAFIQVAMTSVTYVAAMLCTNYALAHVSYPTQVLVKSAKMVPVVVGGFILYRKRYPWYEYVSVVLVTAALVAFNLGKGRMSGGGSGNSALGILFLCGSLLCDGMTGPRQDNLLKHYKFSAVELMYLTNLVAVIWTAIATLAVEGNAPIDFIQLVPETFRLVIYFCVCAAMGQMFVFGCLLHFGSLQLTMITTTRKFFTVLASVMWFGHHLTRIQWACVLTIFATLSFHSTISKWKPKNKAI